MPATYEPIATTTASSTSGVTFSSIPNTYTDLRLSIIVNAGTVGKNIALRLNGDTNTLYSHTELLGTGSAASSSRTTNFSFIYFNYNGGTPNFPSFYTADIFSYAGSTNKTVLLEANEDNNSSGAVIRNVGLYRSTSAITSVTVLPTSGTVSSITATLYGIKSA